MTEQPEPPAPVRVRIDLNARTHDGLYVPARRNLASGPVQRGDTVTAYEPDDGVLTTATVMRLDDDWLHLKVDWDDMQEIPARELGVWRDPQLAERIRDAYAQAERGQTVDLGSFEQYLDAEDPAAVRDCFQHRDDQTAQDGDGYTIGVYLPPEATGADIDAIMTRVADAVHGHQHQGQWDPFVVGHAGDWLYVDHHPDQVTDYAGHVRARWVEDDAEDRAYEQAMRVRKRGGED